ncbi:phosphopantetheine-binding protein [Streptomyces sp. NPDC003006]
MDLLAARQDTLFVEVGAGKGMGELARRHLRTLRHAPVASLPLTGGEEPAAQLLGALGQAWEAGAEVDWAAYYDGETRRHFELPGYPFARDRYWLDAPARAQAPTVTADGNDAQAATAAREASAAPVPAGSGSRTETIVLAAFAEAFGMDDLTLEDDFFGLGGTSLLAAELVHRLRKQLGTDFPVRYLFEAPQVSELAALIDGGSDGGTRSGPPGSGEPDELDELLAQLEGLRRTAKWDTLRFLDPPRTRSHFGITVLEHLVVGPVDLGHT